MTQRDVALGVGRSQSIVSRWEAGARELTPNDLASLGRFLDFAPAAALLASRVPEETRRRASRHWNVEDRRRVGARIQAARTRDGLTPMDFWRRHHLSPYRLWQLESGADPTLAELKLLVEALGSEIADALGPKRRHGQPPFPPGADRANGGHA